MKKLLLALAILASMAQTETRWPADHFCMAGPPMENQKKGHECHCALICETDEEGTPTQRESATCEMYCVKQRCMCHADSQGCKPQGQG